MQSDLTKIPRPNGSVCGNLSDTDHTMLSCKDLRKNFLSRSGNINVLNRINLTVKAGQIVVICGKSGTGKSTLLQLLAGLDRPDSGSINFEGKDLDSISARELTAMRRDYVGIIFQHSNLLPSWTTLENVEAPLYHHDISRKIRRQRTMLLLEQVGLAARASHLPTELSAGQRQRAAIARALINEPRIIFADEPTADLDPQTASAITDLLLENVRSRGASLLVVTHGAFSTGLADQLLTLSNGVVSAYSGIDSADSFDTQELSSLF